VVMLCQGKGQTCRADCVRSMIRTQTRLVAADDCVRYTCTVRNTPKGSSHITVRGSSLHPFAEKKSGGPPPEAEPLDGACITQFGHAESRGRIGSAHKHRARGAIRVQTGGVGDFKKYENPPAAPRRHMHGHMQVPAAPFLRLLSGGS